MAKKITDTTPLSKFEDDWGGTYDSGPNKGKEWGKQHSEVERVVKEKVATMEAGISNKISGVRVNNTELVKDANGKIDILVPTVDSSLNPSSANAVQNSVVSAEINSINSNMAMGAVLDTSREEGGMVPLQFINQEGDMVFEVPIPAAQEIGEVIQPKVTTALACASRVKLGDAIAMSWAYDCIRTFEGVSESVNYPAQTLVITAKVGTAVVWTQTLAQVAVGSTGLVTLDKDVITSAGTVSISVVATTQIDEETKTSRGSKSVTVVTMDLTTTFDPASQLSLSNGYTDGQTISIPYAYTVPTGTTLMVWIDGELDSTPSISGTGRNYVYLTASELASGRHNVQLIAVDPSGLLSNAVSVDVMKAGGSDDYLGMRLSVGVRQLSDMPLPCTYGTTPIAVSSAQFETLELDVAAWNSQALTSSLVVRVDEVVTQTLSADRTLQTVSQRFDTAGDHTMVISLGDGNAFLTFAVNVVAAAGVTEKEATGYLTKLTATGRSNSEENPSDWGGIVTFKGVDWRTNGWMKDADGVEALLLTNGATMYVDQTMFVLDANTGYSIPGDGLGNNGGMTFEMEVKISQVMERGATLIHSLCDNDGSGYPVGIKVTTEEAGLYFGGVEEITTAEDLTDEDGNYIDYDGNIVDEDNKVKLKVTRPHGVAMNIAIDKWVKLAYVVQPVRDGYGLGMLFINGVLSRANRYDTNKTLIHNVATGITFDSDKADIMVRNLRYYRTVLNADEVLGNFIIDRPTAALIQMAHDANAVGDANNTTDKDGNIEINHDTLLSKGRGILTIIRKDDSGHGLTDLFTCTDKDQNFVADLIRWEPPLDSDGNPIGEGFEARNVRVRIQGTSSVKYPYKNIRIYLLKQQGKITRVLIIGGEDVTDTAEGYALRGKSKSIEQDVLCAKTDFVDSSLVMNTGGAHLFNDTMIALGLLTPPQEYDARVRQAIDGIPCDIYCSTSETGALTYCGQFVLNNEKSSSGKIFGMEGVKDANGNEVVWDMPITLESLTNSSPMTLFQPAGSANSSALSAQLDAAFDDGFEFNYPKDAKWATIGATGGDYAKWGKEITDGDGNKWVGAKGCIKRLLGFIYDSIASSDGVKNGSMSIANPDYGTSAGWSEASKSKWKSKHFKEQASKYFNINHLLTYYLFTDYWASVDQRAKNILWRTWNGLIWWATFYDGDTAMSIRNDAFMVYLYNVTRDTYDTERSKYAFEGHNSWLWCLVLANFEDELKACAANLRNHLTTQVMLHEFNEVMQGNWSARQYNKSGKLKYIDTINTMNYVYTLTGNRELHRTQFLTDRARLLDARYGAGNYNGDVITFTVVRKDTDAVSSLTLKSGDLYYFGYKLNGIWLQGPSRADIGESLTLNFTDTLATNDPLMLGGASCISELDLTNMGSQLNGTVGLSNCVMLSKLIMPATKGVSNAPLTLGDISKLEYVDITGQTAVHTGTAGVFDLSKHSRLTTLLAGGTSLTTVNLPEGSPVQTLVLPETLQTLTLRYLPKLTHQGITLQGTSNITALNMSECPGLSWQTILASCPKVNRVRIEGMSGRARSSMLLPFMEGYDATAASPTANMTYHGLTAAGTTTPYPQLIGKVQLIDVVDDFETMRSFFALCGLELKEAPYSEYIFNDLVTDPANITNEDNQTGYDYIDENETYTMAKPNGYEGSGHVKLIRDKSQLCSGIINPKTGKLQVTKLSKDSLFETADGKAFDPTDPNGEEYDVFMYLPHYWYKGVNNYKVALKHFFCSASKERPESTGNTIRYTIQDVHYLTGKGIDNRLYEVGDNIDTIINTATECSVFRVLVEGMKQVRFPGINHSYFSHAFTDENGQIIVLDNLLMESVSGNPSDFMNDEGDYDFRDVPEGAKYLYFTCRNVAATKDGVEIIVTDSTEIEAIEPDWVEHLPELIGVYQGFASGITTGGTPTSGLRSISGKYVSAGNNNTTQVAWAYDKDGNPTALPVSSINGTAQDFFNLASIRGKGYSTVPYETSKDMANLLMVWFGTRDVETIVGRGGGARQKTGVRDTIAFGDSAFTGQNQHNKMWALECWTASTYEWMDKGCLNTPSFDSFKRNYRNAPGGSVGDYYYNIVQQDGKERRVKAAETNSATNVARVRFGRYCDIVVGAFAGDTTYATCYACYQSVTSATGRVLGRSGNGANANAGVAYSSPLNASSSSSPNSGGRLCFFGEIENEDELK